MRRLAVIPARAGSRRIPDKNRREIDGLTLVQHAARAAIDAGFERVVVSTDDPRIACGLDCIRRPAELAGDGADIAQAARHALIECERADGAVYDVVATLQPTVPVRPRGFLAAMLEEMGKAHAAAALTVVPVVPWLWRIEGLSGKGSEKGFSEIARNDWYPDRYPRSQDIRHTYAQEVNSIQLARREVVLAGKRWDLPLLLCCLPRWAYIDIDDCSDLTEARRLWPTVSQLPWEGPMQTHLIDQIGRFFGKSTENGLLAENIGAPG